MTDIAKSIQNLRVIINMLDRPENGDKYIMPTTLHAFRDTAVALESQLTDIATLRAQLTNKDIELQVLRNVANQFQCDLARMTAERDAAIKALGDLRLAYLNKDVDVPHQFEIDALRDTEKILGPLGKERA